MKLMPLFKRTSIPGLLDARSPSAISRSIVPVVVRESIKTVLQARPRTHVFIKVHKIVPSSAHRNATATVIVPGMMVGIVAALTHFCPTGIFRPSFSDCGGPMDGVIANPISARMRVPKKNLSGHATAAHGAIFLAFLRPYVVAKKSFLFSAITNTSPSRASIPNLGDTMQNKQSSESLASQVNQGGRHGN